MHLITGSLLLGFALAAAPAATQSPAPPSPPSVAPSPQVRDTGPAGDSAPVTIHGCLERSKPQASSGEAPQTAYSLRTTPQSGNDSVTYQVLSANDGIKLADHVGHRVQVTAVMRAATNTQPGLSNDGVSPSMRSAGMETMPRPKAAAGEPATAVSVTQPLFVNALKMIDVTCAGKD